LIGSEVNAVGLSASDGGLIRVKKFRPVVEGKSVDIGLVGEVIDSNPMILESLITEGYLPVISPIATDHDGVGYNVNADLVAAAIGGAIRADSVIYLTDVDGIYRNWPDKSSIIGEISISELRAIENSFTDGMIPKVKAAINAIESGAFSVRITNGTKLEAVLDALDNQGGTLVVA
jgi:acetylglutamate kinase